MNLLPCLCKCSFYEFLYVRGNFQWRIIITKFYCTNLKESSVQKRYNFSFNNAQTVNERKNGMPLAFQPCLFCFRFILLSLQIKWSARAWLWNYFLKCAENRHQQTLNSHPLLPRFRGNFVSVLRNGYPFGDDIHIFFYKWWSNTSMASLVRGMIWVWILVFQFVSTLN